jgi:hypothetical protein
VFVIAKHGLYNYIHERRGYAMTQKANVVVIEEELLSVAVGNLADIVMGDYAEIVKLFGADVALKMYVHFRGCHISFPKRFYKPEYVVEIASKQEDRRERERIAIVCGYTSGWLERKVREYMINQVGREGYVR